ncbi:MAG: nuclear transport factor 2 family protein [Rubrobacter sp.]|jgi:limonene-1,2-epoxide hydrolase|nr:nuclear transport factor 2 family protein [Rubrobacter sp.]
MPTVVERMHGALNRHDLEAFLECFDQDYGSEQPIHPNRGFGGKEQVRKNWSAIFESFPDFEADLLRHASDGGTVWSEWHWTATGLNMAGVILMGVDEDRIVWGRLYMEPVEEGGEDIDEAVQRMTGRDQPEEGGST